MLMMDRNNNFFFKYIGGIEFESREEEPGR
jgi:hypothetical protein